MPHSMPMAGRALMRAGLALVLAALAAPAAFAQSSTLLQLKSGADRLIAPLTGKADSRLQQIATFDHQATGVTVTEDGRIFVNFPRWSEDVPVSVAELMHDGTVRPYPDEDWNSWRNVSMGKISPQDHFVCVQSVVADGRGSLFVLDPAAPDAEKTVKNGPKLVQIDLAGNRVKRVYQVGPEVAGPASYLNDVRFAPDGRFAYITDSGAPGGLVVIDLGSGKSWRVLSDDPSTTADLGVTVMTDGKPLRRPDGRQPLFNADSLALSPDGRTLYWKALTGNKLYKIDTAVLQQAATDPNAAAGKAEKVADVEPTDGLWMDRQGRIYLSSMADNAVKVLDPESGRVTPYIADARLRWPDTFSQGPDGMLYVTASHIQDSPWFNPGGWTDKNFALFKFPPPSGQETTGGR